MKTLRHVTCCAVLLLVIGCRNSPTDPAVSRPPSTPTPPSAPTSASISGNVYAIFENNCAPDAAVEVLDGPKAGLRVLQDYKTCVEEGNGWVSFTIDGLPPSVQVTLRASAPGYRSQERRLFPTGTPQRFVLVKQ